MMLSGFPDENFATFTYFDAGYSELQQYGPTIVCGDLVGTEVKTESDPARDFQSSEAVFLKVPQQKT
jgi:hypothetical protein